MPDRTAAEAELLTIRVSIDNIDAAIVYLLAERFRCTRLVADLKARLGLPPLDPAREEFQIRRLRSLAGQARLDPEFAEKYFAFIFREVIHRDQTAREG
jgi:chorismate mutase